VPREEPDATQLFNVIVPLGVAPGQSFAFLAQGQKVLSTCPTDAVAGQKIQVRLPNHQLVGGLQLTYNSNRTDGWKRIIRSVDLKFQWVRLDGDNNTGGISSGGDAEAHYFNFVKSAYVRKIDFLEGNDHRLRTGTVRLVPASEVGVGSQLKIQNQNQPQQTLFSYWDIVEAQGKRLCDKWAWFSRICSELTTPWEKGNVTIFVRRESLLLDSGESIMALSREDLRNRRWQIEFIGEPTIDCGGPIGEWIELLTEQMFDPDCGLWVPSVDKDERVDINPFSGMYNWIRWCVSLLLLMICFS